MFKILLVSCCFDNSIRFKVMGRGRRDGAKSMSKTNITLEMRIGQLPELVASNIDGQIALLSINNGAYYGMDPIASRIWELIAQPRSGQEVCEQLLLEYKVSAEDCRQQVLDFLQKLSEADLLLFHDAKA